MLVTVSHPELTHLTAGSLYPLTNISPFPPPAAPRDHHYTISMSLAFLDSTNKRTHSICLSLSEVTFFAYIIYGNSRLLKWECPFSNGSWKQPS